MRNPPSKPGLELLIRRSGGEGAAGPAFELKVLDSDQAFLRLRPRRSAAAVVERNQLHEDEAVVNVVRFAMAHTERYIRLTPRELFLFEHMDGVHTIMEIATAYVLEFGTLDVDEVRRFLNRARRLDLVAVERSGMLRSKRAAKARLTRLLDVLGRLSFRWNQVDGVFSALYRWLWPLFSPWALPLHALVAGAGLVVYLAGRWDGSLAPARGALDWLLVLACWTPLVMVLHELAHALACKAFGRRVKAIGFTFVEDLAPSVYVDVTDMLMSSQRGRVLVSLAGPAANLVLGGAATLLAAALTPGRGSWALVAFADLNLLLALYTLWPFHPAREDGYVVLTDLLRTPALRGQALSALKARFSGVAQPPRFRKLYAFYLAATAISLLSLVVGLIVVGIRAFSSGA